MRKYRCSFCGYCGFSVFWKTAKTAETAKTAYAISSIILLYFPCATCWISWRLILFCSQRSIVLLPIPRTSAWRIASCLVKSVGTFWKQKEPPEWMALFVLLYKELFLVGPIGWEHSQVWAITPLSILLGCSKQFCCLLWVLLSHRSEMWSD